MNIDVFCPQEINSLDNSAYHNLILVLMMQYKLGEALEQCEKKRKLFAGDSSADNSYGYLKFIMGDYEEAMKSFETACKKDSQDSLYPMNKSLLLYCLGQEELAIEVFNTFPWRNVTFVVGYKINFFSS